MGMGTALSNMGKVLNMLLKAHVEHLAFENRRKTLKDRVISQHAQS